MPVNVVKKNGKIIGYRWGSGKVYKTKAKAEAQGRAVYASGYEQKKRKA